MEKTVILLGFSTTGKSTILQYFKKNYRRKAYYIDTDKEISKDFECHIYNVYLDLMENQDPIERTAPIDYIEKKENYLLDKLCSEKLDKPRLIAAGPFLHTRPNFDKFNNIAKPEYYFLEIDELSVYEGLLYRHQNQIKEGLDNDPYFGCWDLGVTKEFKNGYYELLPKRIAIEKIKEMLNSVQYNYKQLADIRKYNALDYRKDSKNFNRIKLKILIHEIKNSLCIQ